ncbi:MAG: four helix bundle protein [Verrucomicrobia bacterium]|nr:MAG: four helix bundle protein [Verrucomicrobiota bacterium]
MIARSFRDLKVYEAARDAAGTIFLLSRKFPVEERYSLTDQIRRSSRAAKAMIAEAWGRRRYKAVFVNKLDEALGEATETQSWLDDARDAQYLSSEEFNTLDPKYISIGQMLSRMIDRAEDFCKHSPATDYRAIARVEEKESTSEQSSNIEEFFA